MSVAGHAVSHNAEVAAVVSPAQFISCSACFMFLTSVSQEKPIIPPEPDPPADSADAEFEKQAVDLVKKLEEEEAARRASEKADKQAATASTVDADAAKHSEEKLDTRDEWSPPRRLHGADEAISLRERATASGEEQVEVADLKAKLKSAKLEAAKKKKAAGLKTVKTTKQGQAAVKKIDTDGNGVVDHSEFAAAGEMMEDFDNLDLDGNGVLDAKEMGQKCRTEARQQRLEMAQAESPALASPSSPLNAEEEARMKAKRRGRRGSKDRGQNWREKKNLESVKATSLGAVIPSTAMFDAKITAVGTVVIVDSKQTKFGEGDVVSSWCVHWCLKLSLFCGHVR